MPFHQKCANENLLLCLGRTQSLTGPYVKRNLPCSPRFLLSPTAAFENQNQDKTKQSSVDSSSWTAFLFFGYSTEKSVRLKSFHRTYGQVQLCQNWYETVTQDMSYTSLRLKPRPQIGLIWIWDWNQDFKWASYKSKTETKTQYMPYSSLRTVKIQRRHSKNPKVDL